MRKILPMCCVVSMLLVGLPSAWAGDTKTAAPPAPNPAPAANSDCAAAATDPAPAPSAAASKNTGPGRISTNVTVPKQTQGATFGEKVNQGLQSSGGALAQGGATVGATVPGGAVISSRCAKPAGDAEQTTVSTPAATER